MSMCVCVCDKCRPCSNKIDLFDANKIFPLKLQKAVMIRFKITSHYCRKKAIMIEKENNDELYVYNLHVSPIIKIRIQLIIVSVSHIQNSPLQIYKLQLQIQ